MGYQEIHQKIEATNEEKWLAAKVETDYSDHTKAMFRQFVLMYREITDLGIDPDLLYRALIKNEG